MNVWLKVAAIGAAGFVLADLLQPAPQGRGRLMSFQPLPPVLGSTEDECAHAEEAGRKWREADDAYQAALRAHSPDAHRLWGVQEDAYKAWKYYDRRCGHARTRDFQSQF